jgi:hypothetical protein
MQYFFSKNLHNKNMKDFFMTILNECLEKINKIAEKIEGGIL